jgi:lipopolysaccharide export system permease protein
MIRTLDRYLLRSFFSNYVLSLLVLISLYVVLDLFVNLDEFTQGGKSIAEIVTNIGDYYLYNLPLYFAQISGVITLFAACGTFARLQRQNEITAVLASGTSLHRLATPACWSSMRNCSCRWSRRKSSAIEPMSKAFASTSSGSSATAAIA